MTDWPALAQRASRASHDLIGWIYFDPDAAEAYGALGVPNGAGYYAGSRFAPIAGASNGVIEAVAYSINGTFLGAGMDLMRAHTDAESVLAARDARVLPGLREIAPDIVDGLGRFAEPAWATVDALPCSGRALFAAHRDRAERRPDEPALSAWLAFNCLREWRGDTHWALVLAADLDGVEVGLLHNVMVDYDEAEWIARSRGASDDDIAAAWTRLEAKGFADGRRITNAGHTARRALEQRTDELCARMWQTLGEDLTVDYCDLVDAHHDAFVARIDATAGANWMPAIRHR